MSAVKGKLAKKLIDLRGSKTLYQLANDCGIPRSMLHRFESGTRLPTPDYLLKLSSAYEVELFELKKAYFEDVFPEGSTERDDLFRWVKEHLEQSQY